MSAARARHRESAIPPYRWDARRYPRHIGKSDATYLPEFSVDITDSSGTTVARVSNTLRMRRKPDTRSRFGG